MNVSKPKGNIGPWPRCSFFGVYDGHGGHAVADYLRDHLHHLILKDPVFTSDPKQAMLNGCRQAEAQLHVQYEATRDRSGSCAVVVLVVEHMCYIGNVGDCRVIMSGQQGNKIYQITRDHKPQDPVEQARIEKEGGSIYQTRIATHLSLGVDLAQVEAQQRQLGLEVELDPKDKKYYMLGPHRVLPGRLSVARTFGDIEAKLPRTQGKPGVVVATPEISHFRISPDLDFMLIGSDGVFDKLSNKQIVNSIWAISSRLKQNDIHSHCARVVEYILAEAVAHQTLDNISCIFIAFDSYASLVGSTGLPTEPSLF